MMWSGRSVPASGGGASDGKLLAARRRRERVRDVAPGYKTPRQVFIESEYCTGTARRALGRKQMPAVVAQAGGRRWVTNFTHTFEIEPAVPDQRRRCRTDWFTIGWWSARVEKSPWPSRRHYTRLEPYPLRRPDRGRAAKGSYLSCISVRTSRSFGRSGREMAGEQRELGPAGGDGQRAMPGCGGRSPPRTRRPPPPRTASCWRMSWVSRTSATGRHRCAESGCWRTGRRA